MVELKSSTMRPYFATLSRARRASRALKAAYGETKRFAVCEAVEPDPAPVKRKATSNRNRGRVGWEWKVNIIDQLSEIQGGRCYLCGEMMFDGVPELAPTHDHVKPKSRGEKRRNNLCGAHMICNQAKGDRRPLPCELIYLDAVNAIREAKFGPL